eukprot:CAMPEP_0185852156 /NCGR_PEP_ID=MMETSP1354-20130828/13536_1 /TAXON_ID=708628 /ORGANISM="Erythrolobus madagascarensis, Strain CCMP3276" /LENGTH=227 /DNA_ID=CAMNT_0028553335 /DNA_START=24 /DNA_END=707 /DNA_ORIENTATION=-
MTIAEVEDVVFSVVETVRNGAVEYESVARRVDVLLRRMSARASDAACCVHAVVLDARHESTSCSHHDAKYAAVVHVNTLESQFLEVRRCFTRLEQLCDEISAGVYAAERVIADTQANGTVSIQELCEPCWNRPCILEYLRRLRSINRSIQKRFALDSNILNSLQSYDELSASAERWHTTSASSPTTARDPLDRRDKNWIESMHKLRESTRGVVLFEEEKQKPRKASV